MNERDLMDEEERKFAEAMDEYWSKCCVCGKETTNEFLGEPTCGGWNCEWKIQVAHDFHEDHSY